MNCPRCGSENIRRSQSQDSVWFRFVLQKKMRCHRCCYAFATQVWERSTQPATGATSDGLEPTAAASA